MWGHTTFKVPITHNRKGYKRPKTGRDTMSFESTRSDDIQPRPAANVNPAFFKGSHAAGNPVNIIDWEIRKGMFKGATVRLGVSIMKGKHCSFCDTITSYRFTSGFLRWFLCWKCMSKRDRVCVRILYPTLGKSKLTR